MLRYVTTVVQSFFQFAEGLDRAHWILLSAAVLLVGYVSLRGFGERI